jgi:hypothetical protein
VSLYQVSKLLYELNRNDDLKRQFAEDPAPLTAGYELAEEERRAFLERDIGLLYVLGVNGQILMHYAALCGLPWADYLQQMRDGVKRYGPVRDGVYAMMSSPDQKVTI